MWFWRILLLNLCVCVCVCACARHLRIAVWPAISVTESAVSQPSWSAPVALPACTVVGGVWNPADTGHGRKSLLGLVPQNYCDIEGLTPTAF